MPFVSEAQRRKCFLEMHRAHEKGEVAKWDCYKFAKSPKRSPKRTSAKKRSSPQKVFVGPRGGKYKLVKNKKVYL